MTNIAPQGAIDDLQRQSYIESVDVPGQKGVVALNPDGTTIGAGPAIVDQNLVKVGGQPISLGQTTKAASLPVAIASDQGELAENLTKVGGSAIALGQASASVSFPVVIASDQTTIPVVQNDVVVVGSITTTQNVTIPVNGQGTVGIEISGTWTGTLSIQGSVGGNVYNATTALSLASGSPVSSITAGATGNYQAQAAGFQYFRILGNTVLSGTANVTLRGSSAVSSVLLDNAIPTGTNTIGNVGINAGSNNIGSVNIRDTAGNSLSSTSNALNVNISSSVIADQTVNLTKVGGSAVALGQTTKSASLPVTLASDQGTIPISGTVTANIGTTNGLALDATVSGLQVAQGSTTSGQKGDLMLGAVTTGPPSYTTAQTSPLSLTTAGALRTDSSATTQPISATSLPLPTSAATSTKQSDGTQKTQLVDGSGNVIASTTNALNVNISSSGLSNQTVNVTQLGGQSINLGSGAVSTGTQRVTLATDQSIIPVGGNVASGGVNAGNPVKIGGVFVTSQPTVTTGQIVDFQSTNRGGLIVATGADTFNVTVNSALPAGASTIGAVTQASAPWSENITQIGGANIVTAGTSGLIAVGGSVATNVAITDNPLNLGGQGVSSENSVVTTGRKVQFVGDLTGKIITSPYANRENFIKGSATATTNASTSLIAAAGASVKNYIHVLSMFNTGSTTVEVNIQDGSGGTTLWQTGVPAGGGSNVTFPVAIAGTANTAVFFAASGSTTTLYVSGAGYKGY